MRYWLRRKLPHISNIAGLFALPLKRLCCASMSRCDDGLCTDGDSVSDTVRHTIAVDVTLEHELHICTHKVADSHATELGEYGALSDISCLCIHRSILLGATLTPRAKKTSSGRCGSTRIRCCRFLTINPISLRLIFLSIFHFFMRNLYWRIL